MLGGNVVDAVQIAIDLGEVKGPIPIQNRRTPNSLLDEEEQHVS